MVYRVYRVDRLQHILYGVLRGVLARLQRQALMSHILQGDDLATYLLLRELAARYCAILGVVGAVYAAVDAVVREV